jgi:hypothetical protein
VELRIAKHKIFEEIIKKWHSWVMEIKIYLDEIEHSNSEWNWK